MKLRKNSGKILWGVIFILAAVYVIVSRLWILPVVSLWSILGTIVCIWVILQGIRHVNFWEILFPIAFICIIYDKPLGITAITPWTVLGAALLGSIGLSMIFKKKEHGIYFSMGKGDAEDEDDVESYDGESIRIDNSFGSAIKYVNSDNFCKADVDNSFGELTVYFDNAIIASGKAKIKVDNSFGETNLYIPKEWKTENEIGQSFGSVQTHGKCEGTSSNTLKLKGEVSFGEVNIYYI